MRDGEDGLHVDELARKEHGDAVSVVLENGAATEVDTA
jgi:hypothetical protein